MASWGFTGFKGITVPVEEEPDPFDEWVREVREAAGIIDPKPQRVALQKSQFYGQILFSGTITVPKPAFHRTLYGITTGPTDDSDK